jgi:hypothetical protein
MWKNMTNPAIVFAPGPEYGLLLQLKYKFGHTPIMVAVPCLALLAAAGDEAARQPCTWVLLVMHVAGEVHAIRFIQ